MDALLTNAARNLVKSAFREDLDERGDITTLALGADEETTRAAIIAKQEGVICGMDIAPLAFRELKAHVDISDAFDDGRRVDAGERVAQLCGPAYAILVAERTILNFIGRLSGIATLTQQFVDAVAGTKAKILDTRKTTPGWRLLEKYAVTCGGGGNHRIGLYDMFLIKENHIARAGGVAAAVQRCRVYMRRHGFQCAIEVEAQTPEQVAEATDLAVDRIMLDNMTLGQMRECVRVVDGRIPLEASGNVNLNRVRLIAETGVDYISVGALTHSAPVFDFSLLVEE